MKNTYIKAGFELLAAGQSVELVLKNLAEVMKQKGHASLWAGVLRGLVTRIERDNFQALPSVVVAKEKDLVTAKIQQLLQELGSEQKDFTTVIDPTIVGGMKVSHNYRLIDKSYKTKLRNLYQAIVSKTN